MNDLDVREIREKSGLTQEELAERMGMYKENMYQIGTYQSGQIRPLCELIAVIFTAYRLNYKPVMSAIICFQI